MSTPDQPTNANAVVLLLSPYPDRLIAPLETAGDAYFISTDEVDTELLVSNCIGFGISYGYRYILRRDILSVCPFINLHISYLPWNRGTDPNLWSWVDDTPKGVTIHYVDEGIDTGDIIAQRITPMREDETLATSYDKLRNEVENLFAETWPLIRSDRAHRIKQPRCGTYHTASDRQRISHLLTDGYDTPVKTLRAGS